ALWLRCQNPQIQPVLAEPGALPEHKIAAPTAQVIYRQFLIIKIRISIWIIRIFNDNIKPSCAVCLKFTCF
ncbi:MAG: hypothetical protein LBS10_09650, partial [Gracilibacteraceae bacterium]|nr:hypothetical protein [Gracilibacteraceae bacterium]